MREGEGGDKGREVWDVMGNYRIIFLEIFAKVYGTK